MKTFDNINMETRLKSIEKELDGLKRSNRILKRNKKKFERIMVGSILRGSCGRNVIGQVITDLSNERKEYNTTYVKKIETMAEEQISMNKKRAKEDPEMSVSVHQ